MKKRNTPWKLLFVVGLVTLFAYSSNIFDFATSLAFSPGAVGLAVFVVGACVASALTLIRFVHRSRTGFFANLSLRAADNTSRTWKSLLALGHATAAMIGTATLTSTGHRHSPMLS